MVLNDFIYDLIFTFSDRTASTDCEFNGNKEAQNLTFPQFH